MHSLRKKKRESHAIELLEHPAEESSSSETPAQTDESRKMDEDQSTEEAGELDGHSNMTNEDDDSSSSSDEEEKVEEDSDSEDEFGNKKDEMVPRKCCGIRCGQKKKEKKYISLFRIYWVNPWQLPVLFIGFVAAFLQGIVMPGFSIVFGQIFKQFTGDADNIRENAAIIAYCFVGLGVYTAVTTFIYIACFSLAGENICKTLRIKLFDAIMHKDVAFFDKHQTGELTTRLSSDILEVQGGISEKVGQIIGHIASIFMGLGVAFYYGWKLTLVLLALSPLIAIAGALQASLMKLSAKNGKKAFIPTTNLAEEAIGGFKTVLSFVMEGVLSNKYAALLRKPTNIGRRRAFYLASGVSFSFFVMFGTYALGFWYGGQLVADGEMDLGDLLIVFFSVVIGAMGLGQAGQLFPDVTKARAAATEIFDIINTPTEIDPNTKDGLRLDTLDGTLEFKNVEFAYPSRKKSLVFKDLNLRIAAGEKVALVGPSGGGKSSVVALCMRFYDVLAGCLEVDGVDVKDYDLLWLRSQIGLVAQEPILFSCTIAENILYGKQDASQQEIEDAAKMANAHQFITKLPRGYQTRIGEKGCRLSGGQKQRIAIARAILKNPKILLLDEATSALDTESESLVQEALNKLMQGRTSVIIAHRLATIKDAHTIAVMEAGSIVEMGTHDELLHRGGVYSHLVNRQLMHDGQQPEKKKKKHKKHMTKKEKRKSRKNIKRKQRKQNGPALDDGDM